MLRLARTLSLIVIGVLATLGSQSYTAKYRAIIVDHGSLPPVPQLYSCMGTLAKDTYDPAAAQACLDSILASGYFTSGRVQLAEPSSNFINFTLTSPSVFVQQVKFEAPNPFREKMLAWLGRAGELPETGVEYRAYKDQRIVELLRFFFLDWGKQVGVTRNVELDYKTGVALVTYTAHVGPDRVPARAPAPYAPECARTIAGFTTDADDSVPLNLVLKITQMHPFDCFDSHAASSDETALRQTGLFDTVTYDVSGASDGKEIYRRIKGKSIKIESLNLVGYGLLSGHTLTGDPNLPLKAGDIYSTTLALSSIDYLAQKFADPTDNIAVYEDDSVSKSGQLQITFQVFAFEKDRVTINGREFVVPPVALGF